MGAVILVYPRDFRFNTAFTFRYGVVGTEYNWIEKFFVGKDGFTYYIVAISVASFMGLLILISIIWGIVRCCRKTPEESLNNISSVKPSPRMPNDTNLT